MNNYLQKKLLTLIFIALFSFSCQNEINEEILNSSIKEEQVEDETIQVQLIKKLENPYSVNNMRKALDNLTGSNNNSAKSASINGSTNSNEIITATHYYLKFKPKTEEELVFIKSDTTINWFDHPLDYEIAGIGDTYRDPNVSEDQPTYQYTYATIDHSFPKNIEYEILEELFLPEYDGNYEEEEVFFEEKLSKVKKSVVLKTEEGIDNNILLALEDESLRLTDNFDKADSDDEKATGWFSRSYWQPEGYIKYYNPKRTGVLVPLKDVKIRVRRWFKTSYGYTNSSGYFKTNEKFKGSVRYRATWAKKVIGVHSYFITDSTQEPFIHYWFLIEYSKRGDYKRGSWNYNIGSEYIKNTKTDAGIDIERFINR